MFNLNYFQKINMGLYLTSYYYRIRELLVFLFSIFRKYGNITDDIRGYDYCSQVLSVILHGNPTEFCFFVKGFLCSQSPNLVRNCSCTQSIKHIFGTNFYYKSKNSLKVVMPSFFNVLFNQWLIIKYSELL